MWGISDKQRLDRRLGHYNCFSKEEEAISCRLSEKGMLSPLTSCLPLPTDLIKNQTTTRFEAIAGRQKKMADVAGSGKTFIAMRLIKRFREALQKPWGEGGKRTFFLVNTVPLVAQQKKNIERLCPVNGVGAYCGEDGVDYWDKNKWDAELTKNQGDWAMTHHAGPGTRPIRWRVLTTADAAGTNGLTCLSKHGRTRDNVLVTHPMTGHCERLTATLLNANVNMNKVQDTLRDLEKTFHATIATVNELGEVLNYSSNPNELVFYYSSTRPTEAVNGARILLEDLKAIILSIELPRVRGTCDVPLERGQLDITTDPKKIVKAVKNMIEGMITLMNELGSYGGSLGILAYTILLERLKRKCSSKEEDLLYQIAITHSTEARMVLLDSMANDTGYDRILKHSSKKLLYILQILKEYNPKYYNSPGALMKINKGRKPLSGIIFAQQRFTAKVLYNLLKDVREANPDEFGFLKHDFIVGFNINPMKSTREQHYLKKCSHKALLKFKNKDLNCLISTSVIEEGVDISQCLLVVRYDPPLEYRSYIQSKGRARSSESSFVLLVSETNRDNFLKQYAAFQRTENFIQRMLVGNTEEREAPTAEDIREGLYDDDEIPPYITECGNRLSAASAISLISRYCSTLPHDQFTVITPMWILEKDRNKEKNTITIIMPIACPVKEKIKGQPFETLKSAKRSAALNACVRLHQEGELDRVTLLPRHYGKVNFEDPDIKQCFLNWRWDEKDDKDENAPKPGTKKMVRKYEKVFPSCLKSSKTWIMGQRTFYLHVIKMKTAFEEPSESRERALYNLLRRSEGYGLLTPSALPKLCDFPMFLTVGEVATSLEVNYAVIQLDLSLFEIVKQFHHFIFDQVLDIAKKFLVYDGEDNNMFVVPIKSEDGYNIDWDVMLKYKTVRPVEIPSSEERRKLRVTREDYQNTVVTPWYRGCLLTERYIVSDVIEYMTPKSQFDSHSYGTYEDYYASKYNLEIYGQKDQPLLEVRNISTRGNCLMPRAASIRAFTEKQRKLVAAAQGDDKPTNAFMEIFIPEFCIKYDYPGVLWYKAIMLPSIVHRVFNLLIAHELREEITIGTKYGKTHLDRGEEWLPIQVDLHIAMKSLLSQVEEPTAINTIDRINNPIDDTVPRPLNIVSMKETVYQLQNKKISKEYPWDEKIEPVDIERNLSTVTVMDIECYDEFVSARVDPEQPKVVKSPERPTTSAAIMPPPRKYIDKIKLLTRTPKGRGPELRDILSALTTINSGDSFNLERAETLGDSFLKFAASLYLFHKFPQLNEGQLTNIKCKLLGNRNLYYAGSRVKLGGRMKIELFSPRRDFLVPGFFAPQDAKDLIEAKQYKSTIMYVVEYNIYL
uniref:Dicer 2 n=1 Tax=Chilo suppressalis TaxID=168631 RepID=A0A977TE00_CHISP|nr:Dicer 2 [Chilo suppressalis]